MLGSRRGPNALIAHPLREEERLNKAWQNIAETLAASREEVRLPAYFEGTHVNLCGSASTEPICQTAQTAEATTAHLVAQDTVD